MSNNDTNHTMTEADAIKAFVLAGNSKFTLRSVQSGKHYTFRVRAPSKGNSFNYDADIRFVAVLMGPDNTKDFQYLGFVKQPSGHYSHGFKSKVGLDAPSNAAFDFFWRAMQGGTMPVERLEFFHSGSCGRCGRSLTTPISVTLGLGPVCAAKGA